MANYTTVQIKELREQTGAGMMDVKKALDEADGDMAKALEIIRVKGLKGLVKREGRATSAGLVSAKVLDGADGQSGVMIEFNSETDFVAKAEKFMDLANRITEAAAKLDQVDLDGVLAAPLADGGTVQEAIDALAATIGEKLQLRRATKVTGAHVDLYLHKTSPDLPPQVGVLLATDELGAATAHDVAMHIAAYSPTFLTRDDVPAELVENERRIAEQIAIEEGKPEAALPKIVEGRMKGFFKENVLVEQAFAKDPKLTIADVFAVERGAPTGFARFRVGA